MVYSLSRRQVFSQLAVGLGAVGLSAALPAQAQNRNNLVFVFQKQSDPNKIKGTAEKLATLLEASLGRKIQVVVPADYSASVQALVARQADVAYVSALPFLLARRDGQASMLLAEQRVDPQGKARTDYDSIFVVRNNSPLKSFADVKKSAKSLSMVFTSPTSTSGYVFPYARFIREEMLKPKQDPRQAFRTVSFGGSYTQALQEVIAGRADIAAVSDYTMTGPKADVYLPAAERAKLRVLARTPGVPTHLIATRSGLDPALRTKIAQALTDISQKQPDILADVYGASRFVRMDENTHVKAAVDAIAFTGIPIEGLAR
jgi:phosphonate transport system substrate-binding protein